MNWIEAVEAMARGALVRRKSEVPAGADEQINSLSTVEPLCLLPAVDQGGKAVRVFVGAWSRQLCAPSEDARAATDWEIAL